MIGFSADDPLMAQFSRGRIQSLRKTIVLYYLAIIVPFAALAWTFPERRPTQIFGAILLLAVLLRFRHWMRPLPLERREDVNPVAARVTAAMVILLSLAQAYLYISLPSASGGGGPTAIGWGQIVGLGMLSGFAQGAALTGVIFASRVIFLCLVFPLVGASIFLFSGGDNLISAAMGAIASIGFYLAELGHKVQLRLFRAQFDADEALSRTEQANTDLLAARRSAQYRAEYDGLTAVRNRYAFMRDIEARLLDGEGGILAVVDLDRFKPINDLYGHHAGDMVLRFVARRLQRSLPAGAIVGRLGGDEFALFVPGGDGPNSPEAMCDRALARLRRPIRLPNALVSIGSSAGGRLVTGGSIGAAQALRDADSALYVAKREGLDTIRVFDDAIRNEANRLNAIETAMGKRDALDQFSLAYQPIVNLRTGEVSSFEALARWHHPELGEISPSQFIAIAERNGRIREITIALLDKALKFARDWPPACRLSFNLSAAHVCGDAAASEIIAQVEASGFPPDRLQFEITETAMLVNFDVARRNIEMLREAGCRIALDDFGAGFASLVYLREIRFDKVKIDGSLIRGARDADGRDMLNGVIKMLSAMKLESVAEFIATDRDRDTALSLGAQFGQGYFLGRPMRASEVTALLAKTDEGARTALNRRSGFERRIAGMAKREGQVHLTARGFAG
jgi:diguanylate cyclase (GGDEF)-like protein